MDKVSFRFNDPCQPCKEGIGCDECDHLPKEGSEKSVKRNTRVGNEGVTIPAEPTRAVEKQAETDSRGSFWNSNPLKDMTPEQRKHFKKVMRIEVRK